MLNDAAQFLIIESDPTKIDSLSTVARFVGAGNVTACQSTNEAELAMGNNSFGFVLCRDQLSPENGCQFVARMRAQGMQTPVVFVSSSPAAHNVLEAAEIANTEFLTIPFSIAELKACINRISVSEAPVPSLHPTGRSPAAATFSAAESESGFTPYRQSPGAAKLE